MEKKTDIFFAGTPESHPVTFGAGSHFAAGAMLFEELGLPEEDCSSTPEPRNTGKGRPSRAELETQEQK
jgi:hypothetical protein